MEEHIIKTGEQTQISPELKQVCEGFSSTRLNLIYDLLDWMQDHIRVEHNRRDKIELFRKRTASKILEDGFATGCSDLAILFVTISRACRLPARYVKMMRNEQEREGFQWYVIVESLINNN